MKNILIILFLCSFAFNCGANKNELSKVDGTVSKEKTVTDESASKKDASMDKADTTVKTDLNGDGTEETIKLAVTMKKDGKFDVITGFNLAINDKIIGKTFDPDFPPGYVELIITNINKNDKAKQVFVNCDFDPSGITFYIYNFDGKNINFIDTIDTFYPETNYSEFFPGDGKILTNDWMGFWKKNDSYTYDPQKGKLTKDNTDGIYNVILADGIKNEFSVTKSFRLRKDRDDKSDVTASLVKGNKIKILKSDIKSKCNDNTSVEDMYLCHWYYIESGSEKGWVRLKDFKDNVEGLPWAG